MEEEEEAKQADMEVGEETGGETERRMEARGDRVVGEVRKGRRLRKGSKEKKEELENRRETVEETKRGRE